MFNGLLPASLWTFHQPSADGSGPSGRILGNIAAASANPDGADRLFSAVNEDFDGELDSGGATSGKITDRLSFYADTGATLKSSVAEMGGVLEMALAATLDDQVSVKGGVSAVLDGYTTWMESRANLLVGQGTVFFGLMDPGPAADNILGAGGVLPDANYFGIKIESGIVKLVTRKTGSPETVLADELATVVGKHSLGFIYSRKPLTSTWEKCTAYIDNNVVANVPADQLTDELVPKNVPLSAVFVVQNTVAAVNTVGLDWMYCKSLMS